ncbi:hypothetical protein [Bradyrhizobium sp.]|uniref:hypothetical protein n=1 Tax=Bradyrhizobium sp. TaxID=376 RepID=UPI0039E66F6A
MRKAGLNALTTFGARAPLVISAFLLALAPGAALAQQNNSIDKSYTDISGFLWSGNQGVPQQAVAGNPTLSSSVTQIGQMNSATATLAGSGNVTTQYQLGSQNTSNLSANGTQNTLTTTQIGNSNTSNVSVNGNNNSISNLQVGSGLTYQLQVVGTNAPVSIQQYGRR